MQKKLKLAVMALCYSPLAFAQSNQTQDRKNEGTMDESAFTFTEAQLGEDDDMSQNVTIINSNNNVYASEVGYLFSPVRFRYRAFNQKYNDVYINGAPMNDMETGQFRYSLVGGLNQQTKTVDFALPFESNAFSMTGMGGSNNYDFRAGKMATGHRFALAGANRNYTLRGMYSYASGFNNRGWAFAGALTYRWANQGIVEGTFYNALSYYLGVQKVWGSKHSLSFATWGNPTERSSQGASTDEVYWLANNNQYNPYWGYQNGKKRNSRVVNDFAPTALLSWDWNISDNTKLTTSLQGRYSWYKSTKLNYNGENPQPDYWKNLPSSNYNVWDPTDASNTADAVEKWQEAYDYWTASKANRQINWDKLYWGNLQASAQGNDAIYYIQAKHNDNLNLSLSSVLTSQLSKSQNLAVGLNLATNKGMHYQTMDDLLGATQFHNVNTYAIGTYPATSDKVQYDLNNPNAVVGEGDRFGYDYNIYVNKGQLWSSYTEDFGPLHYSISGRLGYTAMQREGNMRNGMAADNSFGKSGTAEFVDGGFKFGSSLNLGHGHAFTLGLGYEMRAPQASTAFASPEINNDFVQNLKNERVFSSELGYQYQNAWVHANVNAYYSRMTNVTEWQCFYFDDENSFTYNSLTGIKKHYYGLEAGLKFKIASFLDLKMLGTLSEAKNINNSHVRYMMSNSGEYKDDVVYNKDMRESGTPLTAASVGLDYHKGGWYVSLNANYYDRIYLSYSAYQRYGTPMSKRGAFDIDEDGNQVIKEDLSQAKGKGGFMLDGSIGRSIYLKKGMLSINLTVNNILNNERLCTGGYEQSRSDNSFALDGTVSKARTYKFSKNPKKFYALGTNGMLNIAYKF